MHYLVLGNNREAALEARQEAAVAVSRALFVSLPYSWCLLLQRPQAPHLLTFARSRILTVQVSTPPARSVAKATSYGTWRRFATKASWIREG